MQSQSVSRLTKSRPTCGVRVLLVHPAKVCTHTSCRSTFSSHCKFSLPPSRIKLYEAWRHLAWPWIPACWAPEKKTCVKTEGLNATVDICCGQDTRDKRWEKVHDAWLSNINIYIYSFFKICFCLTLISLCHLYTVFWLYLILLDRVLHTKCVPLVFGLSFP